MNQGMIAIIASLAMAMANCHVACARPAESAAPRRRRRQDSAAKLQIATAAVATANFATLRKYADLAKW